LRPRSAPVTTLAWPVVLGSAALTPISFLTLLMVLVGSHGTASAAVVRFVSVVPAPPVTLLSGIGLLRRNPWARYDLPTLCAVVLVYHAYGLLSASSEPTRFVSPSGVPTTVLPTARSIFLLTIVAGGAVTLVGWGIAQARRNGSAYTASLDICIRTHICMGVMSPKVVPRPRPSRAARVRIAARLREILDSALFRALSEPARGAILEFLTANGRSDIATIAERFPQDRSVISRHLAVLADAGLVRRQKEGRNVFFEVDGVAAVDELEAILERFRSLVPLCCPSTVENDELNE
jgi:DNA-binding transcriptional ArsR family regulator